MISSLIRHGRVAIGCRFLGSCCVQQQKWHELSASDISFAIKKGEVTSSEILEYFIDRIEKIDTKDINAVVYRDFDRARPVVLIYSFEKLIILKFLIGPAPACWMKVLRMQTPLACYTGFLSPLGKTLMWLVTCDMNLLCDYEAHLNSIGWPSRVGSQEKQGKVAAPLDSKVVYNLEQAGAIIVGKTNVSEDLADWQCDNAEYGRTNNPWDTSRTCGGSSGGSAASVASRVTPLSVGTDIGGGIALPSHFCGVYAHKPSYGLVPTTKQSAQGQESEIGYKAAADMLVHGVVSNYPQDCKLCLEVLMDKRFQNLSQQKSKPLNQCKVAVWDADPDEHFVVSDSVHHVAHSFAGELESMGVEVVKNPVPKGFSSKFVFDTYLSLVSAVYQARMSEADYQELSREIARAYTSDCGGLSGSFNPDYILSLRDHTISHRRWCELNDTREKLRLMWHNFFLHEGFDFLITPCASTPAFPHLTDTSKTQRLSYMPSQRTINVDDVQQPYHHLSFWGSLTSSAFLPSTIFPAGKSSEGLPIGLQCISSEMQDFPMIDFVDKFASELRKKN
eukprot:m.149375 g.149375  ORF g.149375 m.149375 type:complete len:562 (+) comp15011_c0_seq11:188-1873(+)